MTSGTDAFRMPLFIEQIKKQGCGIALRRKLIRILILLGILAVLWAVASPFLERQLLFYPTHLPHDNSLTPWFKDGEIIGYARTVDSPENVWLMLHGNAGQASDRIYAMPSFSDEDSIYILEYPGFGNRKGVPSKKSLDRAAEEAYIYLRESYPQTPVCVAAESIGSGPASSLARLPVQPDKFVLIAPFDSLHAVAANHMPGFLVRMILRTNWDNVEALSNYEGPVDIFAAEGDTIIPLKHAEALAAAVPGSNLTIIDGGHNDWSYGDRVRIRNP